MEENIRTEVFYEETYYKFAVQVRNAFKVKGKEWFSLSNLHKISNMRHDEIRDIMGILVSGGLVEHDRKEGKYRIVTEPVKRLEIIRSNIERAEEQSRGMMASIEMMKNWLKYVQETNPSCQ